MRSPELQLTKVKRILFYFQELDRMKVSHNASLDFMSYIFHVREDRLLRIFRENDLEDLKDVQLHHADLDLKLIDAYASKLHKIAKLERTPQLKMAI